MNQLSSEEIKQLIQNLHTLFTTKKFTIKSTGLSYRIINSWDSKGLLDHFRKEQGQWHKFTFLELIQIQFFKELRNLGVAVPKIKKVRDVLDLVLELSEDDPHRKMFEDECLKDFHYTTLFHAFTSTVRGEQMYFVFNSDFDRLDLVNRKEYAQKVLQGIEICEARGIKDSLFITLSLTQVMNDILKGDYFTKSKDESLADLLDLIQNPKYAKLELFFKDEKLNAIKGEDYLKYDPEKTSLHKLVKANQNQHITICTNNDGNITTIKRNTRIK